MSDFIEDPEHAYKKWGCYGHYMEVKWPGTESGVCSDKCEQRFNCWKRKNQEPQKPQEPSSSQK